MKKLSLFLFAGMTLTTSMAMAYSPAEESGSIVCTSKENGRSKFEAVIRGELAEVYYQDEKGETMAFNLNQTYDTGKIDGFYLAQDKIEVDLKLKQGLGLKAEFVFSNNIELSDGSIVLNNDFLKAKCKKIK
jgi:hypothetical protein